MSEQADISGRIKFSADLQFWDKDGKLIETKTVEREVPVAEFLTTEKEEL